MTNVYSYLHFSVYADGYLYSLRHSIGYTGENVPQSLSSVRILTSQQTIHLAETAPATPRHLAVAFDYCAQHIQINPTISSNVNQNPKTRKQRTCIWLQQVLNTILLTNHASLRRFIHCWHVFWHHTNVSLPVRNSCNLRDTPSGTKSAGTLPHQGALATPHPEASGPFATTAAQHTRWLPHCREHLGECLGRFEAPAITACCPSVLFECHCLGQTPKASWDGCSTAWSWSNTNSNPNCGSSEIILPTIGQMQQLGWEESEKRKIQKKKNRKKEDQCSPKGRKGARHCVVSNVFWLRSVDKWYR